MNTVAHYAVGRLAMVVFATVLGAACSRPPLQQEAAASPPAGSVNSVGKNVAPLYAWTQWGADGPEARALMTAGLTCPATTVDGAAVPMIVRAAADSGDFPIVSCAAPIAVNASSVSIGRKSLPVPTTSPEHILVLGDTGCRVTAGWYENCDGTGSGDPWSFVAAATAAAAEKPDLIVHVGDYVYREAACDTAAQPGCAGSPFGDRWATWEADFFQPSRPLLDAAPWIFTRGNHEDCDRNHLGWLRFLDGRPIQPTDLSPAGCPRYAAPYKVELESVDFLILNTASDPGTAGGVAQYAANFTRAAGLVTAGQPTWTVTHRPFWALEPNWKTPDVLLVTDSNLQAAIAQMPGGAWPGEVQLALAGHIHLLETISFPDGRPHQVVSGDAGTAKDAAITASAIKNNQALFAQLGISETDFNSFHDFGYVLLDADGKGGWNVTVKGIDGDLKEIFHLD